MSGLDLFHQIGTAIFALGSLFVATRLLWLSRETGRRPELFLGLGIAGSVLGYGIMVVGMGLRGDDLSTPSTPASAALQGIGQAVHNVGLSASLLFVLSVFRPTERWARGVLVLMMACLWGGYAGIAVIDGFRSDMVGEPVWLLQYAVIWTYPLWSAAESFRYYAMMRRRFALGLADPLVVNRFLLWGVASLATAVAIWIASIAFALIGQPQQLASATPMIRVATAAVGIVTISCYGLTFFPTRRYAAWVRGDWSASSAKG